jgi:hypothetical protein
LKRTVSKSPVLLALLALFMGCGRCGSAGSRFGAVPLLQVLPRDAEAVAVAPDVGKLGEKVQRLQRLKVVGFLAQLQGFPTVDDLMTALMAGLGVDLRSDVAMRQVGMDPERGWALVVKDASHAYVAVAVHDQKRFVDAVASLAQSRLGAVQRTHSQEQGLDVTTFRGAGPALSVVVNHGFAFLGTRASPAELGQAATVAKDRSLAQDEAFARSLARLPPGEDLWARLAPGSALGSDLLPRGATLGVMLDSGGLLLSADFPRAGSGPNWLSPSSSSPEDLTPLLPKDAFAALRFQGNPALVEPLFNEVAGPVVAAQLRAAGIDLKKEVLDDMEPGAVAALALSPHATLGGGLPAFDVRRTNPFQYVQLVAAAKAKDEAGLDATLAKLSLAGPKLGLRVETRTAGGRTTYVTSYARGEGASVAREGKTVVVASPVARVAEAFARKAGGGAEPAPAVQALSSTPLSVVVDLKALGDQVRELPSEAWGVGGFALKATALNWLELLSDLKAVQISASSQAEATQLSARLQMSVP